MCGTVFDLDKMLKNEQLRCYISFILSMLKKGSSHAVGTFSHAFLTLGQPMQGKMFWVPQLF
jgi:hypothetical protein